MDPRLCVRCSKPLPGMSKMTVTRVLPAEAREAGWIGEPEGEMVAVPMCLQCQIERAEASKGRS